MTKFKMIACINSTQEKEWRGFNAAFRNLGNKEVHYWMISNLERCEGDIVENIIYDEIIFEDSHFILSFVDVGCFEQVMLFAKIKDTDGDKEFAADLCLTLFKKYLVTAMSNGDERIFNIVLSAYNRHNESEHDGVDYVFDIKKAEDVRCVLGGGLSVDAICAIYNGFANGQTSRYFLYGQNYDKPAVFRDYDALVGFLGNALDEVITDIFLRQITTNEGALLYNEYIKFKSIK